MEKIVCKIKWLIQDVGISFTQLNDKYAALDELGFSFDTFGVIPLTNTLTGLENVLEKDTYYVSLSGTKVLSVLNEVKDIREINENLSDEQMDPENEQLARLKESIFYDVDKFDQHKYSQLDLPLLNEGSDYYPIKDNMNLTFDEAKFIKPSRDLKAFNGGILEAGISISDFILNQQYQEFYIDEIAVIAPLKKIYAEYRFFIVDKKVVTGSMYKNRGHVKASSFIPDHIQKAAEEYCLLYQPHAVFTLDIADTPDGCKIVEYNCWNCSGAYHCDLIKIYKAIADYIKIKC